MKKISFLWAVALIFSFSTYNVAGNWYNDGTKWVKNITPELLQFHTQNTASVRTQIFPTVGGANPNPAITTATHDLWNGYFAITGGQIAAGDVTDPVNVRQAFVIPDTSVIAPQALRFAQSTATVTDGGKAGKFLGYVNLNWYLPQKYSGYNVSFKSRVYNAGTFGLQLLVYDAGGTQLGTTQNLNTAGWNTATFAQSSTRPMRFKMSIPSTAGLVAYYETPEMLLTSSTEPATRQVTVIPIGNGTVTPVHGTLHDQDTEVFIITPYKNSVTNTSESLISVNYDGKSVTPVNNGDGTYTFTTPLLSTDGILQIEFSDIKSMVKSENTTGFYLSSEKSAMIINGLNPGQTISIYSAGGHLIQNFTATHSSERVAMPSGIYLVKSAGLIKKIVL